MRSTIIEVDIFEEAAPLSVGHNGDRTSSVGSLQEHDFITRRCMQHDDTLHSFALEDLYAHDFVRVLIF